MKRLITIAIAIATLVSAKAQYDQESLLRNLENGDSTEVTLPDTVSVEKAPEVSKTIEIEIDDAKIDTTKIRFGKKKVFIIEKDGTTAIEIPKDEKYYRYDDEDEDGDDNDRDEDFVYKKKPRFEGHWAGFEWGFNGFMDPNYSINMKDDLKYLELRQGRSWNINLNILQYSLGFGTDKIGLVTGLGFEFNDYHFRNKTNIKVVDGITGVDSSYIQNGYNVTKTKLSTSHLTVPLLLEFQIPTYSDRHRIFFSTGVIGGVRLGTHTKVIYEDNNEKKDKVKDDFNLSAFRYGLTARIGYRGLKLFANYYPTALFEKDKGPEIYPFSVGLILLSFN